MLSTLRIRIRNRLLLLVTAAFVFLGVIAAYALVLQKDAMMQAHRAKAQGIIELAYSVTDHFGRLAAAGKMDVAAAQEAAKAALAAMRYDGDSYLSLFDLDHRILMHPIKSELVGTDQAGLKDANDVRIVYELVQAAKRGHGEFVAYLWPRPGSDVPAAKLSAAKLYAPWGWVVSSGIYVDDVDGEFRHQALVLGGGVVVALFLLGLVSWAIARQFTQVEVDVAARQLAEDAVRHEKRRLAAILDGLPDAAFVVDQDHQVVAWNRALTAMTGATAADMLGKGQGDYGVPFYGERRLILVDLLGMPDQEVARKYPVVRREGDVLSGEVTINVQGRTLYVEARACALRDADGAIVGGIEIIRDLTERKRFEDELAAAREVAEKASQAKADFLANMSHEIRTPMNAIVGMTHLALRTELDAKQRNYLEKVEGAAKGLLGIINDILDFSKIEAGKIVFERVDFDLDDVLDGIADLAAMKAQDKGLELLFDVGTDVPTALVGDPLRLGQVLTNLVGNAIKFTERGEVTVVIRREAEDADGVRLGFAIRDTGIGMTEAQRTALFTPFTQADSSTTRKYGGTGLGLTICKRLVDLMAGEIVVDSQPGRGSTFMFSARFGRHAGVAPLHAVAAQVPGLRVLVVDDNASARDIFLAMLGALRFDAAAVADGAAALDELKRAQDEGRPYGLVLMDWDMPQQDGIDAVRRIQADTGLAATPTCMMVTAYSREEMQAQLERDQVKVEALLVKPVSPSTLCDSIMTVFGKKIGRRLHQERRAAGHREAQASLTGCRILLVEDNDINRELALELLEAAGIDAAVAANGAEALELLADREFDAVLMDCQMPVMDGFEATRRLRDDGRTLPVIAMTANAMAGDREKCLAAGMNDHIAKPIDVGQMFKTLAQWVKPAAPAASRLVPAARPAVMATIDGLDTASALARLGGDTALLCKMLARFREGQAGVVGEMRAALAAGDRATAQRLAHTLKGLAGNIGAGELAGVAGLLEAALRADGAALPDDLFAAAEQALAGVLGRIDGALPAATEDGAADTAAAADVAALTPALRELARLLADDDAEATAQVEPLAAQLKHSAVAPEFRRLGKLTEDFEFEQAHALLREIAAKLSVALE